MGKTSAPPLDGEAIRQARLRLFLTQAEVAEQVAALGVPFDRSGLSLIESGLVKRPRLKLVHALGKVLGLEGDALFGGEDDGGGDEEEDEDGGAKAA